MLGPDAAQLYSLGGTMIAQTFNRKIAVFVGLLVLASDVVLLNLEHPPLPGAICVLAVNFPGYIPAVLVTMAIAPFLTAPLPTVWYVVSDVCVGLLSAIFWAFIFGYVFRRKVAA